MSHNVLSLNISLSLLPAASFPTPIGYLNLIIQSKILLKEFLGWLRINNLSQNSVDILRNLVAVDTLNTSHNFFDTAIREDPEFERFDVGFAAAAKTSWTDKGRGSNKRRYCNQKQSEKQIRIHSTRRSTDVVQCKGAELFASARKGGKPSILYYLRCENFGVRRIEN